MIKARFFDGISPNEHEVTITPSGSFFYVHYMENGFRKEHAFRLSEVSVQKDKNEVIVTKGDVVVIMERNDWNQIGPSPSENNKKLIVPSLVVALLFFSLIIWHDRVIIELTTLVPDFFLKGAAREAKETFEKKNCLTDEQEKIVESAFIRLGKNRDEFTFYLIPSAEKNAYAMPGNILVFHDSLFKDLDSMEAFTGILAHEVAHIEKDHLKRAVVKGLLVELGAFAVLGDQGAIIKMIVARKYNQAEESEADREAAKMLHDAQIDPGGVRKFFEAKKKTESSLDYIASSHPVYDARIKTFLPTRKDFVPMRKEDWAVLSRGCQSNL